MRTRILAAGVVVAVGLVSTVAGASSPPATTHNCGHLIVDPRGNSYEFFLPTKPYNPEADLLTVDAVTSPSYVTFTVRMASVNPHPTTGTSVSIYFSVDHQGGTSDYLVSVNHQIDGTNYLVQNQDTNQVTAIGGATNPTTGTYVMTVPRADIGAKFRGAMLTGLGVITGQDVGINAANLGFIEQSTGPGYHYRVGYGYGCRK